MANGRDYLKAIKVELEKGRHQRRMGENVLSAFGYVKRRQSALVEINRVMQDIGLVANPSVDGNMPLRAPRIRFSLASNSGVDEIEAPQNGAAPSEEEELAEEEAATVGLLTELLSGEQPALLEFKVKNRPWSGNQLSAVPPSESLKQAYTRMCLDKRSYLVVANGNEPKYSDVKGVISFGSITDAFLRGESPQQVRECMDPRPPAVGLDGDIEQVIDDLAKHEVVLITGPGDRVVGIVTAWDLQEEFSSLAVPFSLIAEVESRLRIAVAALSLTQVRDFLTEQGVDTAGYQSVNDLTLGELLRILQNPVLWEVVAIPNYDRALLIGALEEVRDFRNDLMHFRGPLEAGDIQRLRDVCEMVRRIPLKKK